MCIYIYYIYISIYRVCSNMFPFFVFIFHIIFPSEKVGFPFFDFGGALEKFCLALPEPNCEGVDQSVGRDGRSISLSLVVWCVLGGEPQVHNIVFLFDGCTLLLIAIRTLQVSLKYPIGTSKMGAPRHGNERAEGEKKTDSC